MNCDLFKDGHCTKYRKNGVCIPSEVTWCDEPMMVIEANQICRQSSIFGNYLLCITEEQIEALRNGKVLRNKDAEEYNVFIALKKEKEKTK